MKEVNEVKAGAILSYASIFATIIIGLIYTPIMLRLLGQSEYGLYSLIGSVVGYLSILDLGLGNAIVRYTARNRVIGDRESEARLNGMFVALYCVIGLVTVIIGTILYLNLDNMFEATLSAFELQKAKIMTLLLIFNFAVSFPLGVFGSIIQAYEKFVFFKLLAIARTLLNPLIILPLLLWGYGAVAMVVVQTVLNLAVLLVNMVYCLRVLNVKIYFGQYDWALLKEIAGYSFFIFLNIIVDKVYWSTGQFILGIVSGTVLVAIYAIAMQLTTMYIMFSTAVSGVLLPRITMMVANDASSEALSEMMVRIGRVQYVVMALILSGFILFGQAFINLWAGENYREAYHIVLLVMIPITVPLIQNTGILILQAKNRQGFRSVVYLAIAVMNIAASIPLAKMWGGLGCALATGVSLLIGNVIIMNIYYHRKIHLNIPMFWKNIIRMSVPVALAMGCGYGINMFINQSGFLGLGLKIVMFSVVYVVLMWLWGLNSYEKDLFGSPVRKVFNRAAIARGR